MTANATRRRDRSARPTGEDSFRRAVPMAGTGDGPRPDPTAFAPATRRSGDERRADEPRSGPRSTGERRAASNRTADDDLTQ